MGWDQCGEDSDRAVDPRSLRLEGDVVHVQLALAVSLIPSMEGDSVVAVNCDSQRLVVWADQFVGGSQKDRVVRGCGAPRAEGRVGYGP